MIDQADLPVISTEDQGGTAAAPPAPPKMKTKPARPRLDRMPPWKVLLHNDNINDMGYVVETILMLTTLKGPEAISCMLEAHRTGLALLLTTHQEHAELLQEQFKSKQLLVTIEPDEC